MEQNQLVVLFISLFVLVLGLALTLTAFVVSKLQKSKYRVCSRMTAGTVVRNLEERESLGADDTSRISYHAVVEYTADDAVYTMRSILGRTKPLYRAGDTVTVHYDPTNPEKFYIEEDTGVLEKIYRLFFIIGIAMLIVGAAVTVMAVLM